MDKFPIFVACFFVSVFIIFFSLFQLDTNKKNLKSKTYPEADQVKKQLNKPKKISKQEIVTLRSDFRAVRGKFTAPQICMAAFISQFHWAETPRGGENKIGVYIHPKQDNNDVHLFISQYGKLRCKLENDQIIWANYNGRWRNHQLDTKIFFQVTHNQVQIIERHMDGSQGLKFYTHKKLQRLTSHSFTENNLPAIKAAYRKYQKKNQINSGLSSNLTSRYVTPYKSNKNSENTNFTNEFLKNLKAVKRKELRKANRISDNICHKIYPLFGSTDDYFRRQKCIRDGRKQNRLIYE